MTVVIIVKLILIFLTTLVGMLFILPELTQIASTWVLTTRDSKDKYFSLIDYPDNYRKVHSAPKPVVGGIGMLIVVSFSSLIFVPPTDLNLRGYYSAVILLGIIGFLDDFGNLHYGWKFVGQVVAVLIMVQYSNTVIESLGTIPFFGTVYLGILSIPVTIFCAIGVINAINMMDGLDGLAGAVSLIAFSAFAVLSVLNGLMEMTLLTTALIGAIIGFLKYNWHPARIFMGDSGSHFLGFSLVFLSIAISQSADSNGIVPPVVPLVILTVPVADTVSVMLKRIIKGRSPFSADKNHLHHILLRMGLDAKRTVIYITLLSAGFAFLGVAGVILPISETYLVFTFLVFFIIFFTAHIILEKLTPEKIQTGKQGIA